MSNVTPSPAIKMEEDDTPILKKRDIPHEASTDDTVPSSVSGWLSDDYESCDDDTTYVDPDDEPFVQDDNDEDDDVLDDESVLLDDVQPADLQGTMDDTTELLDSDIVCGNKTPRNHPGNLAYHRCVDEYAAAYCQATNKKRFVEELITKMPGRCLKKITTEEGACIYEVVSKDFLVSKLSKALAQKKDAKNDHGKPPLDCMDGEDLTDDAQKEELLLHRMDCNDATVAVKSLKIKLEDDVRLEVPFVVDDPRTYDDSIMLKDTDIVSGKCAKNTSHPGNVYFRKVMKESVTAWRKADNKSSFVIDLIYNRFANHRFVKYQAESRRLAVLSEEEILVRVREGLNNHKKQSMKNIASSDVEDTDIFCGTFAKGRGPREHVGNTYFLRMIKNRLHQWKQTGSNSDKKKKLISKIRQQDFRGYRFLKHVGGTGNNAKFSHLNKLDTEKRIRTALLNQKGPAAISKNIIEEDPKRKSQTNESVPRKKAKVIATESKVKSTAIKQEDGPLPVKSHTEASALLNQSSDIVDLTAGTSTCRTYDSLAEDSKKEGKRSLRDVFVALGSMDVKEVDEACKMLSDVKQCFGASPKSASKLVQEGVVLFNAVQALQTHKDSVFIVQQILNFISKVHKLNIPRYWDMLTGALNGMSAVTDAMNTHQHDSDIQELGLKCFRRMIRMQPLIPDAIVGSIINATIASMKNFERDERFQSRACALLKALADHSDSACNTIKQAKGGSALFSVAENFPGTRQADDAEAILGKLCALNN